MKQLIKQKQVVLITGNNYRVIFTDRDEERVKDFLKKNRPQLKKQGKVISNYGFYEK